MYKANYSKKNIFVQINAFNLRFNVQFCQDETVKWYSIALKLATTLVTHFVIRNVILIGRNDFSFQFRKIITRYRRNCYNLNCMRQSASLVLTQSWLITMLPSLIAHR